MTKGIISLARDFGVELIAEGVENADQLHVLQELGCDYIQGYYFSKPWRRVNLSPGTKHLSGNRNGNV